jgi:hypothetical protein
MPRLGWTVISKTILVLAPGPAPQPECVCVCVTGSSAEHPQLGPVRDVCVCVCLEGVRKGFPIDCTWGGGVCHFFKKLVLF